MNNPNNSDNSNHVMVDTDGVGDNQQNIPDVTTDDPATVDSVWSKFGTDISEM